MSIINSKYYKASVVICSDSISGSVIAQILDIKEGHVTREKGRPISPRMPDKLAEWSVWELESDLPDSAHLVDHIDNVLSKIEANRDAYMSLFPQCTAEIACLVSFEEHFNNFRFFPELIQRLASLSMSIWIDIYAGTESEATE